MDGALDSHSGHGTFIAGLIRQISPDTDILALRIMASDGIVQEGDLLQALSVLHGSPPAARPTTAGTSPSTSSRSRWATTTRPRTTTHLDPLCATDRGSADLGVCVLACAGNDATRRKMYPAAFAPRRHGHELEVPDTTLPTLSVGALNPDGTTALFSNGGGWVLTWEVGAALVSTFPKTFNGGAQPSVGSRRHTGAREPRSTRTRSRAASAPGAAPASRPRSWPRGSPQQLQPLLGLRPSPTPIARMWQAITAATGLRSQ